MKRLLGIIGLAISVSNLQVQARSSKAVDIDIVIVKKRTDKLRHEIAMLKGTLSDNEALQTKLKIELADFEYGFSTRFEKVLMPLLFWPSLSVDQKLLSWVERDHLEMVLAATRDRLVKEPLEMIADRESRLHQTQNLKSDFSENLKSLESKENLLAMQLEELQIVQARMNGRNNSRDNKSGRPANPKERGPQ